MSQWWSLTVLIQLADVSLLENDAKGFIVYVLTLKTYEEDAVSKLNYRTIGSVTKIKITESELTSHIDYYGCQLCCILISKRIQNESVS